MPRRRPDTDEPPAPIRKANRTKRIDARTVRAEGHRPNPPSTLAPKLEAQTQRQRDYLNSINHHILTFGLGPAGTGKTYVAAARAAEALRNKEIKKLILTRPAVEAGEKLGFLPGTKEEKYEPYLRPYLDTLNKHLGRGVVDCALKSGAIEPIPLAFMRGMTFEDCWVILDEAQNTTVAQMRMFLTRIGQRSKVIVNGDITQCDLPQGHRSGLDYAAGALWSLEDSEIIRFTEGDIVRHDIVQHILTLFARAAA